jgi:phosphohistidine phosphatase SixA
MPYEPNRGGHAPAYLREAFLRWLYDPTREEAVVGWNEKRRSGRWLFGQLWNCTDVLSSPIPHAVQTAGQGLITAPAAAPCVWQFGPVPRFRCRSYERVAP